MQKKNLQVINDYLAGLHVTMWQSWNINDAGERDLAARWLHKTMLDVADFFDQQGLVK